MCGVGGGGGGKQQHITNFGLFSNKTAVLSSFPETNTAFRVTWITGISLVAIEWIEQDSPLSPPPLPVRVQFRPKSNIISADISPVRAP